MSKKHLKKWATSIFQYTDEHFSIHDDLSPSESVNSSLSLIETLVEIGELFSKPFLRHDNLDVLRFEHNPQEIHVQSEKLETDIYFGFDYKGFYLSNRLTFQEHFKSTNDDFWIKFISLFEMGDVEILESYSSDSESFKLFEKQTTYNKSQILKSFSSIVFQIAEEDVMGHLDIEVRINESENFEELIKIAQEIFSTFYRLNYLLYKRRQ